MGCTALTPVLGWKSFSWALLLAWCLALRWGASWTRLDVSESCSWS